MKPTKPASKSLFGVFTKRPNRRTSQKFELQFEKLEPRQMLAGDLVFQANFEDVSVPHGSFEFFANVSGLTATGAPVEIQNNHPDVGPASQGDNLLELDGTNGVFVDISNVPSQGLVLQLDYSARRGIDEVQNTIEVLWNGEMVASLSADGRQLTSTNFQPFEFRLSGDNSTGRLEFRSLTENDIDGEGGLLDDINVFEYKHSPVLEAIDDLSVNEGDSVSVQLVASDPDSTQDQLRYSTTRSPVGSTLDPITGQFSWTPGNAAGGFRFGIDVAVTDETGLTDTQTFRINVNEVDGGPTFQAIDDLQIDAGDTVTVQLVATDPNSTQDQLSFSTTRSPIGSTLDPDTGEFSWTPSYTAGGLRFGIDVVVTDETGLTDTETFRINVNEVEDGPTLQPIEDQEIDEGETVTVQLIATDPNSTKDQLRYSTTRSPVGSTLDPVTGEFTWTPNQSAGGLRFGIDVVVTDETGLTDTKTFRIDVNDVGEGAAPVLQAVSDQTIRENETLTIQLVATDADSDQSQLRYSAVRSPVGSTLDPVTGQFSWTPNLYAGGLSFGIDLRVTDETGLSDLTTFRVTVENLNESPVLAFIEDQTIERNSELSFIATATDADRPMESLTFTLSGSVPAGAAIDPVTGRFSWTPTNNTPVGLYTFDVVVDDGAGNQDSQSINVEVTAVDDSIELFEGSNFETMAERTIEITEDTKRLSFNYATSFDLNDIDFINDAFEVALLDNEGQSLVHTIGPNRDAFFNLTEQETALAGVNTEIDGATVRLDLSHIADGTTANLVFRLVNNDDDTGTEVQVTSIATSDEVLLTPAGASTDSPVNGPFEPIDFDNLSDVTGSLTIDYGQTSLNQETNSLFTVIELTNVGQVAISGRMLAVFENPTSDQVRLIRPEGRLPDGRFFIELTSTSGVLAPGETTRSRDLTMFNPDSELFNFDLTILAEINSAPTGFTSTPPTIVEAGRTLTYTAVANDNDSGQTLTYSIVVGNEAIEIENTTGELTWLTTIDDLGNNRITIRATDPFGLFVEQTFSVKVVETLQNRPPIFTTDPVTDATASSGFEVTTVATGDHPAGVGVISGFQGPRIVTINSNDQTVGVYAGQNNDRFDNPTSYSTGFPTAAGQLFDVGYSVDIGLPEFLLTGDINGVFGLDQGDLNGDGILDLTVLYTYDSSSLNPRYQLVISTLLGDGDGSFGSPVEIYRHDIGSNSYDVRNLLLRDINNDGALDVLAAERRRDPRLITILGNGDGTFDAAVEQTFSSNLSDFRTADIDEDGKLDLIGRTAILGFGASYDAVWLKGIGDGTFGEPIVITPAGSDANCCYATQQRPYDVLDLNDDGNLDLAFLTDLGVTIYHSDGSGNFILASEFRPSSTNEINWIRGGDFNNDGNMDLAYNDSWNGQLNLLFGDGSGIDFVFRVGPDTDAWLANYAGDDAPTDVDGDGDLDLIFAHSSNDWTSTKVALNDGAGNFSITEFAMVDFSGEIKPLSPGDIARGAMFGDYNQDGVIDYSYFTSGIDFNGVGIRLGTRPGEFGQTRTVPALTGQVSTETLAADFDGDGIVDLLNISNDRIFLGNGDGTFGEPFPSAGVSRPTGVGAVADFNLDNLTDVVATRARQNGSRYYVGLANGDGTFTISDDQLGGGFYGYSDIQIADFNLDGLPDFVAKDTTAKIIDVYLNDPLNPGVFALTHQETLPAGSQGTNVSHWEHAFVAEDFTGDGVPDLAFASREPGEQMMLVVMAGDGAGSFALHHEFAAYQEDVLSPILGSYSQAGDYMAGDLDGDDDVDIVIASLVGPRIYLNDGTGVFEFSQHLENSGRAQRSRDSWLVDFNADGHLDLVTDSDISSTTRGRGPLSVRLGRGDATFDPAQRIGMVGSTAEGVFVDVDHDGHLDFVHGSSGVGNYRSGTTSIYAGRRDDLIDMIAVDLNGDGNEEILTIQEQMDRLQLFVGDNLGGLTRQPDLLAGRAPQAVAVADLDADGNLELITANRASRSLSVFVGDLASGYTSTEVLVGNGPIDVAVADVNGDGHVDIVALDDSLNALWVFAGDGTSTLGQPTAIALGDNPGRLTLADADGDGAIEAVITLPDSDRLMIIGDLASNTPGSPIYIDLASKPSDVAVVDLNDDGNPDLAVTLAEEDVLSVFYGRGNNQFATPQNIRVGDNPTRVTLSDADDDGRTDLIVANSGDATASVIYNRFDPNEVYRYDADAIDPDNDVLTYSIVDGPGGLIINSESGELLWAASPDQVGEHEVTIAADDGRGGVATQTFKIDVQPARDNASPLIATEPSVTIGANETFKYSATAVDGDNDALRYRLLDGPEGATVDPTTGEVHWDGRGQAFIYAPYGQAGDVRVPADASLQSSDLTVEGWFNNHTLSASNGASVLFSLPGEFGHAYYLRFLYNTQIELIMDFEGERVDYRPAFEVDADRWYHIALTIDDSAKTATISVDGQVVGSTDIPDSIGYSADGVMEVGQRSSFPTMATLDNFRVWNVARSAAEIQEGMARQYEDDPRIVLDYRFEDIRALSVTDYSDYGNVGYRTSNGSLPLPTDGLVDPGQYDFTIAVEDGRGGYDEQTFTVNVLPELRGTISGHLFDDLDGDGVQDDGSQNPAEESLEGWRLYIDTNGNHYPDPGELQTVTDANGDYQFDRLLPGNYPVRVDPVAGFETPTVDPVSVEVNHTTSVDVAAIQHALSQIQGQLKTEDGQTIGYWNVFADLDQDGTRSADEPEAMTDRDGFFALFGLDAGSYTVRAKLPAGWQETMDVLVVDLNANEISTGNDIEVAPTNTSVTGGVRFVTTPPTTIVARDIFRYAAVATSIVPQTITYDLSLAPEGLTIDPTSGLVAWRPSILQQGGHQVILRATDAGGSIALHDFTITVSAPNTAPVIGSAAPVVGFVGKGFTYDLAAQDAELEAITFAIVDGPAAATLDPDSGQLRWTPTAGDVGVVNFEIEARDASGETSAQEFAVTISADQPDATPFNITPPRENVGLGQDYVSRVVGVDQLNRPLTWSKTSGPAGLTVNENGDVNWTANASQLGQHTIELSATNIDGESEDYTFVITVVGQPVINSPNIVSEPVLSTVIGAPYSYDVQVEDAEDTLFTFTLLSAPQGMSIHASNGTIRWTPAADQMGEADVSIEVIDPDGSTATQSFKLKVSRSGGPPIITSTPPTEVNIGASYLYSVIARDAEGDPLSYRLLTAPTGVSIVETTGEISWTPTVAQLGPQEIVIEVSDGVGGAATQAFSILVGDGVVNLPPVIESTASRFTAVGSEYEYQIVATDPESSTLSYTLGRGPTGMSVDASGLVSWTPTIGQTGKFVVTLVVTDVGGASAIESFELDVLAENRAPVINSTPPETTVLGAAFGYDVLVTDADLDRLQFELVSGPAGAEVNTFGQIRWDNGDAAFGFYDFEIKVSDPRGGEASQAFTVELVADTQAPSLSLIENLGDSSRNILPWQGPFKVFVRAIDNVEVASLTLTANGQEILLDADGTATFTFEDWSFADISATATAIDTSGNTTTKTISFDYDFPFGWDGAGSEDIPTAEISTPNDTASVTGMVSIVGTAAHSDLFGYKLSYRRVDETSFTEFHESTTAVTDGELGVWDTSLLLNDEYVLRLEVATNAGVVNVVEHNVGLAGVLKLGNFQLAFTDMVIPVAGIPIEITRVYDTLQSDREGDFGYGWRLEFRDTDLRVGLPKSGLEDIGIFPALRPGVKVYLNVPGQGRQGFTFNPDIRVLPGFGGNNLVVARPRFTADPGVTATLSTGTSSYLQVNEFGELYAPGGIPYNPASPSFGGAFTLTSREGITYRIDGATGKLSSATDRNGNRVEFTESGVESDKSGQIVFERDAHGRVISITDFEGHQLRYEYNSAGDLIKAIDRENNETTIAYLSARPHYIETIVDPLGREGVKTEYDENGRLLGSRNVRGAATTFSFDPDNFITEATIAGKVVIYEHDNFGNVVSVTDGVGNQIRNSFDADGNLISETMPNGATTNFQLDTNGNTVSITGPQGTSTSFTYDADDNLLSTTDPEGNTTWFEYDVNGNLVAQTDAEGNRTTMQYDTSGNRISTTSTTGATNRTNFDEFGNPVEQIDSLGNTHSFSFDRNGQMTGNSAMVELPSGGLVEKTIQFELDANGNRLSSTSPDGSVIHQEYDALDRLTKVIDQQGRETVLSGNDTPTPGSVLLPDGSEVTLEYSLANDPVTLTNLNGDIEHYEYDAAGSLVRRVLPDETPEDLSDNPFFAYEYNGLQQLIAVIDPANNRTEYEYDVSGNQVLIRDAIGNETRFEYDSNRRQTLVIDGLGRETRYAYDALGNMVQTILADGSLISQEYDSEGNLIRVVDPAGDSMTFEYDMENRVVGVIDAIGNATRYELDQFGNVVSQTDALGRKTRYEYDEFLRQTAVIRPGGERSEISYTVDNRIDQQSDFAGHVSGYTYDQNNRLETISYGDGTESQFTMDGEGNITSVTDARGVTSYQYDAQQRLIEQVNADGSFLRYQYDKNSNITSIETPDSTTTYVYNVLDQLTRVVGPDGGETTFTYDAVGNQLGAEYGNGTFETWVYDSLNRVTSIELFDANSVEILQTDYEHDVLGQVIRIESSDGRLTTFEYDANQQLVEEIHLIGGQTRVLGYTYDAVGNRVEHYDSEVGTTTYTYDVNDRLVSTGGAEVATFTYDAQGNLTRRVESTGDETAYVWDVRNRLVEVEATSGGQTEEVEYQYDHAGNRIARIDSSGETRFLVDTNRRYAEVFHEYLSDGTITSQYLVAPQGVIASGTSGELRYLHSDYIDTVYAVTDVNADLLGSYVHSAFGELLMETGPSDNRIRFNGQYVDEASGLTYLRARHLDNTTGRFLSTDPVQGRVEDPRSLHRYVYSHNNPSNFSDPSGELTLMELMVVTTITGTTLAMMQQIWSFAKGFTETVNWQGTSVSLSGGASVGATFSAGISFGIQANVMGTLEAPRRENPRVYDKANIGGSLTLFSGGSVTYNATQVDIPLDASFSVGGFSVEVPRSLTPRVFPSAALGGGYLQLAVTVATLVGGALEAPVFMGFGAGDASGWTFATLAGVDGGVSMGVTAPIFGQNSSASTASSVRGFVDDIVRQWLGR